MTYAASISGKKVIFSSEARRENNCNFLKLDGVSFSVHSMTPDEDDVAVGIVHSN